MPLGSRQSASRASGAQDPDVAGACCTNGSQIGGSWCRFRRCQRTIYLLPPRSVVQRPRSYVSLAMRADRRVAMDRDLAVRALLRNLLGRVLLADLRASADVRTSMVAGCVPDLHALAAVRALEDEVALEVHAPGRLLHRSPSLPRSPTSGRRSEPLSRLCGLGQQPLGNPRKRYCSRACRDRACRVRASTGAAK